jgi:hypothetical protein
MPPRRTGKAATRRARQRRAQRTLPPAPRPAAVPQAAEDAGLEGQAEAAIEEPRRASAPVPSAPSATRAYATGGSSLTDRERAEYHYVERDLRNIGILSVVLFVLLIAAWFVFNALGLIG